jgi:succinyl-diaminopimelate desuccinylase
MVNPIPLLEELVKIDSSTKSGVNKIMDFSKEWLEQRGLEVKKLENSGYSMLVCEIGSGEETIVFNAHLDVVNGEEHQFTPIKKDGKMYGRGTVDMKAGAAAMMETVADLQKENLPCRVMLQIVPDEETGGTLGTKYLTEQGYLGDFIICGEPTNFGIAIQSKGVLQLDIDFEGTSAHGSRPWEGKNAIHKAMDLYEQIYKLPFAETTAPPVYGKPSINLAAINGGGTYNKVPKECSMSLDIRYLPDQDAREIVKEIESITDGEIYVHDIGAPVRTEEHNPYVQDLSRSLVQETDLEKANLYGQHGSNDGKFFTPYGGASVEFGPAGHDWHGEKEMVYMDSVKEYQRILADFVRTVKPAAVGIK